MGIRYTDAADDSKEFVIRERTPSIFHLMLLFVATVVASVSISLLVASPFLLSIILTALFTIVGFYVITQIQRNRDLVLATEFQNALFTSALGSNNKFCLIIKNDGTLTYMDRAFNDLFSDFVKLPYRHIDALLKYGEVQQDECDKIYAAIEHNVNDSLVFTIKASDNKPHKIVMSIEPITRPTGYIMLRARDFVEQRTSAGQSASGGVSALKLPAAVIQLFSRVLEKEKAAFITDPSGIMLYVSPALEHQLGYGENEIINRNLALNDFIYVGGSKPDALALEDYEGEIILQRKDANLIKCQISQSLVKDKQNRLIGCVASVSQQGGATSKGNW